MITPSGVNWLFLDLNSYFASVEQQLNPKLRGRPTAVIPVNADTTCCIAASYEAKRCGVCTGMRVYEAKALCPAIQLVIAHENRYVAYHHRIRDAVESCVPIHAVLSIDEMICRLTGTQRQIPQAMALARHIKGTIAEKVGSELKSSIGLAPNPYLAKVAGEMQKPDGLTVLTKGDLPGILFRLSLRDLPGIGEQTEQRLRRRGIHSVKALCALDTGEMREIWGGVVGERFWSWLRGEETPETPGHRHSIGHSHVLEPQARSIPAVYRIAKQLTSKAAVRLRQEKFWTTGLSLRVRFGGDDEWEARAKFVEAQDTSTMLKALAELWNRIPNQKPFWISVTFHPLIPERLHNPSLFQNGQDRLSIVMDEINGRYGRNTAYFASLHDAIDQGPNRIAFRHIPELSEF